MGNAEEIAARVFAGILGTYDTWSIYVGDKLGLYRAMATGPMTVDEFVATTGMDRRYAVEWLQQQVVSEFVSVDGDHFSLPEGSREVFTDPDSLNFLAPFVRLVTAAGLQMPALLDAYQNGGGVSWSQFGDDMRTGQAEMNRPWFLNALATEWFPKVPEIHQRLLEGGKVADIGCGEGWSAIAMALAYPESRVDGFDLDRPSIEAASRNAVGSGVADRVAFHAVDAASADGAGNYDVVTAFECIHDLADPVAVLATMRKLVKPAGQVLVMDERVAEEFPGEGDVERLMYGFSLFTCLPDGLSHSPSVGTGTVMRPAILESYAIAAGFSGVEILPIENDLWRFYRLNY